MHIFETIVTIGMVIAGCVVALVPARLLLKMDRRSGYWIYTQEMKATGDEKKAIAKAATFYRALGGCLIVLALAIYLVVLFLAPAKSMKFSIRDMMFVTVIVALAVAWWLDRSRLISQLEYIEAKLMLEKSQAEAEAGLAKATAEYEAARALFAKAEAANKEALGSLTSPRSPNSSEGPVRGYNLLGPDLPEPHEPAKR